MSRPIYLASARNRWSLVPSPPTDHPKAQRAWLRRGKLLACCALEPFVVLGTHGAPEGVGHLYHLSISHPTRYPTWEEISRARHDLLPADVWMVQVLAPAPTTSTCIRTASTCGSRRKLRTSQTPARCSWARAGSTGPSSALWM